jgi:hypothetical protein
MATATPITNTTRYPVYASKTAFLADFEEQVRHYGSDQEKLREMLYRLSNTDTDNWTADSDERHSGET